jgi:hypothetical protein
MTEAMNPSEVMMSYPKKLIQIEKKHVSKPFLKNFRRKLILVSIDNLLW